MRIPITPPTYDTIRRLLAVLSKEGPLSTPELAKALNFTPMGVRNYLLDLERDGYVRSRLERRPVGRPCRVYSLNEERARKFFPGAYAEFALDVLDGVAQMYGEDALMLVLKVNVEHLFARWSRPLEGLPSDDKVKQLAADMAEQGRLIDWEEREGVLVLKEYNCGLYQAAKSHPSICRSERDLYEKLFDAEVTLDTCLTRGDRFCGFIIKPRSAGASKRAPTKASEKRSPEPSPV